MRVEFSEIFLVKIQKNVTLQYLCNFVIQVNSKLICSTSLMFATAFIDISLIFVQLGLEKSGKMI